MPPLAQQVLDFWLVESRAEDWFSSSVAVDEKVRSRFSTAVEAASVGQLDDWAHTPGGWLALLILLDQFRRNVYRNDARAWACDDKALALALAGIARGDDQQLPPLQRLFAYLPLEHAEDLALQDRCVVLFEKLCAGVEPGQRKPFLGFLDYARRHRQVIEQFGRFPHRNAVLGRASSSAEQTYLAAPDAGF
ncbi:MAG: DUF924 family protein [Rhodanobacter sp.]